MSRIDFHVSCGRCWFRSWTAWWCWIRKVTASLRNFTMRNPRPNKLLWRLFYSKRRKRFKRRAKVSFIVIWDCSLLQNAFDACRFLFYYFSMVSARANWLFVYFFLFTVSAAAEVLLVDNELVVFRSGIECKFFISGPLEEVCYCSPFC